MRDLGRVTTKRDVAKNVVGFGSAELKGMAEKNAEPRDAGMSGDIVFSVEPQGDPPKQASAAWSRQVLVKLQTAGGIVHDWFTRTISAKAGIADDSSAGTASLVSNNLVFVNGVAELTVNGSNHEWLEGEVVTITAQECDGANAVMGKTIASVNGTITIAAAT